MACIDSAADRRNISEFRRIICVCVYVWQVSTLLQIEETYSHFHNDCFFSSIKKTQVQIPEPKHTGSVFVLSVRYQYSFFNAKKRQSL